MELPASAPVVDEFHLLKSGDIGELTEILRTIKMKSGVEISVYIPSSLREREISDFSIAVAEAWKLGRKKEDKGLLFIIAPKERKMRFEVGYGLEGELTDAFTRRILDNIVRPAFKRGDYYEGILGGIGAIQEKIPLGLDAQQIEQPEKPKNIIIVLFIILVLFSLIIRFLAAIGGGGHRGVRGGSWGGGYGGPSGSGSWGGFGGGGSGGSWGGGGGGFGGGGSSSDW